MNMQELFKTARARALAPLPGVQELTVEQRGRIQGQFEWLEGEVHRLMDETDRRYEVYCREREAKLEATVEEVRYQCKEELQDHIDDLVEELAACKEDSAADRQTIQHLVAVVAKLVK